MHVMRGVECVFTLDRTALLSHFNDPTFESGLIAYFKP